MLGGRFTIVGAGATIGTLLFLGKQNHDMQEVTKVQVATLVDRRSRLFAFQSFVKGVVDCLRVEVFKYASNQIHRVKAEIECSARMHVLNIKAVNLDPLP